MSKTDISINLTNVDGNAFSLLGVCQRALRQNGMSDRIEDFRSEATSGDYTHLLSTIMDWFEVEYDDPDEDDDETDDYSFLDDVRYPD